MENIRSLPDDGPVIDCPPHDGGWSDYFNKNVACGDLFTEQSWLYPGDKPIWVKAEGCGARDWSPKRTFWYPRPGKQFEITCQKCNRMFGVEVRTQDFQP